MKHTKLKNLILIVGVTFCFLSVPVLSGAEEPQLSSAELITKAWEAHGRKDAEATFKYTQACIDAYGALADKEQSELSGLPKNKDEIEALQALNDVATAYFIQAESYMRQEKLNDAKRVFQLIIDKYSYAQAWDQRGWYWKIADTAKQSIQKIETGNIELQKKVQVSQRPTKVILYDAGSADFIDYTKFGEFQGVGTKEYKYVVTDQEGLSHAVGEGIYPNTTSVRWDPEFKKVREEGRLEGSQWDFLHSPDLEAAFLKWATSSEPQGVRLFYTALILEKAGLVKSAIKCYYAIVVHFPGSYGWTYWRTPWYVGQAAIAKINYLLRRNRQLGYRLADADINIINGFDNDVSNDVAVVNPGRFEKVGLLDAFKSAPSRDSLSIKQRRGKGKVRLVQYETGDWQLLVENKPFIIKGVTYAPTKIGQSPDNGTLGDWMFEDFNKNGHIDGPDDAFVDANKNNRKDAFEPVVGDFALMRKMGVNVIRLYHHPNKINKELLRYMYKKYGIRVIMGDFLGKYAIGSGAPWNPGTDYKNPEHQKNMLASVKSMIMEYKDEPYVLFWLLGNENVYGYACNANTEPDAFYTFADDVAKEIKALDPNHPVALCNGDILFLDRLGKDAPNIDIFGANAYRGDFGFGSLWKQVKSQVDRPAFITEYGCSAYAEGKTAEQAEVLQAEYHRGSWEDIRNNMAFRGGVGNALGGVVFEWLDEWWKGYEPKIHDTKGLWTGPFPDGYMHEEWLGICGQGDGSQSPFLRHLRKAYFMYKKLWK